MNVEDMNNRTWIFILVLFIGYANAVSPYIANSSCGSYSALSEDFNGTVCMLNIKDSDSGDYIKIRPNSSDTFIYFDIIRDGGTNDVWVKVTIKKLLDRETVGVLLKLKLIITDLHCNEVEYEHAVYITDVNDNVPEFQYLPYILDIDELPCQNNTIIYSQINATDKDSGSFGTVTYFMTSDASKQLYSKTFSIDQTNGSLSIHQCLDYETNNFYHFILTAKDGGGKNSSVDIFIRVRDVQDMPPFFTGKQYMIEVNENIGPGTSLVQINAKDGDIAVSNDVLYRITDSSCGDIFDIDSDSGIITTNGILDRDSGLIKYQSGDCILTVKAKELNTSKSTAQYGYTTATANVTIFVKDVDDNSPEFSYKRYKANISENTAKYVPLALYEYIHVSDRDQDSKNARMTITLQNEDGSYCTDFFPSPNKIQGSGNIQLMVQNSSFLDYEKIQNTTIKVIATEDVNSTKTAESLVQIEIIDVNDVSPKFNRTSLELSINESTSNGTVIGQIKATDGDRSEKFKKVTYSISGGNGRFIVDENTGYIRVNCSSCTAELDREIQDIYYMTYTAEDVDKRSDSVLITIKLTDINDNKPIFLSTYKAVVDENDRKYLNETAFVKIEARDGDEKATNNSKVMYTIKETSPKNLKNNFTIVNIDQSGEIHLKTALDYEKLNDTQGEIHITVEASDKGEPVLSNTVIITLHVQDVNDNMPTFNATYYNATVPEDTTSEEINYTHIAQVFAHDADCTERNSLVNFIIIKGGSDRFRIDARTGMVSVQLGAVLDREKASNYTIEIMAIDQGYPSQNSTTYMFIDVTDVNDSPPTFNQSEYAVSIKENTKLSEAVFLCNVEDLDLDSKLQYDIKHVKAFDEAEREVNISHVSAYHTEVKYYFGIDKDNGTVYIRSTLDRETAEKIILTLFVTDDNAVHLKSQTATATLTIKLEDVNDNYPEFNNDSYKFSIIENAQNGTIIGIVTATDKDLKRTITYSLADGSKSKFLIDTHNGVLTKRSELDREKNPTENLTVIAKDNGIPSKNRSVYVLIDVADFNDNAPQFGNFNRTIHLEENSCNGTTILFVYATDIDEGPNAQITFSIEKYKEGFEINGRTISKQAHEYNSTFSIDPITGAVSLDACLNYEKNSYYQFEIVAKNGGGLKSTADLIIHVNDVQDEPPFFTGKYRKDINGSIAKGEKIIQVVAVDGDFGQPNNISYSMMYSSCGDGLFSIDTHTGDVYATTNINSRSGTVSKQFGVCILTIEASEIQRSSKKQYGNTTAVTDVILTLHDTDNTPSIINPTQANGNLQYTTNEISPTSKIPHSCHEKWDFENPCNESTVLNGVTKFPHPDSIYKFLICDVSGKTFSASCPRNEVFIARCSKCELPNQNFSNSCFLSKENIKNPCSKENVMAGNLTFPHPESSSKYILCDSEGNAWEEDCFSGSRWDQSNLICVLPEAYNPCKRLGSIVQSLYPHYCNPRLYVQCDYKGHPFVHSCPKDYVFLHYELTCVPPGFPGSEYLRYTCKKD